MDSEEQLVAKAQDGDKDALGELLFNSYDDLASFLRRKIPKPAARQVDAEDLMQQVFASAYRDIGKFEYRGDGSFQAWLRSIGEYRLRDAVRGMQAKKRGGDRVQVEGGATESFVDVLTTIAGDDPTASQAMRQGEARRAMQLAIAELPEDYRQVIRLRFFELKSIDETSQIMERSPSSVRALADRAKKQLRETIGRISAYLSARDYGG